MSECMLCQVRRAEHPYLIESIGLNVYSVEELLYFMERNIPLLDGTILNEDLVRWLKDELHMRRLSVNLSMVLQRNFSVRDFVMPETVFSDMAGIFARSIRTVLRLKKQRETKNPEIPLPGFCGITSDARMPASSRWRSSFRVWRRASGC